VIEIHSTKLDKIRLPQRLLGQPPCKPCPYLLENRESQLPWISRPLFLHILHNFLKFPGPPVLPNAIHRWTKVRAAQTKLPRLFLAQIPSLVCLKPLRSSGCSTLGSIRIDTVRRAISRENEGFIGSSNPYTGNWKYHITRMPHQTVFPAISRC